MTCPHWGEDNRDEAVFCKSCGLKMIQDEKISPVVFGQQKQSIFSRVGGMAGGLIGIVIIYAVVNGLLWFGQEAYHHDDNANLKQMESNISALEAKIKNFENSMELYGATDAGYAGYEAMIEEYNKLVNDHNSLAKESDTRWYVVPIPTGQQ